MVVEMGVDLEGVVVEGGYEGAGGGEDGAREGRTLGTCRQVVAGGTCEGTCGGGWGTCEGTCGGGWGDV